MLRINLLPSYVSQRRLTRKLIIGFGALFIVCLVAPILFYLQAESAKNEWETKASQAEAGKAITDGLKQQASDTRGQIAPIQAKVDYVKAVHQHNQDIVTFWDTVARYSNGSKMIYSDAVVSGATLTIKAYSPSIAEVGRYLQAMYQEPDFQSVGVDRLPGYPEAVVDKYYLGNRLIAIGSSSGGGASGGGYPGGGSRSFGGGFPGGGGMPGGGGYPGGGFRGGGGYPGGAGGGTGQPAFGSSAGIGGTGSGAAGGVPTIGGTQTVGGRNGNSTSTAGADVQQLAQVLSNDPQFRSVQMNPFAPPQSRLQAIYNVVKRVKKRREPQGFPITITATLKQPLSIPAVPGAAGAPGAGGPMGMAGPMGMPGGYPGAMPGGYPGMSGGYPGAMPGGYPGGVPGGYPGGAPPVK